MEVKKKKKPFSTIKIDKLNKNSVFQAKIIIIIL